jgi:acyl carrier protein
MSAQDQVFNDVVAIISKHVKNQEAMKTVNADTDILKDLQVNSARLVDIVLDFEEKFDLEIADDELDKILTVGDAVTLVGKLLN